jgi:Fe-S cluster assembly protein SufD
MTGAAAEARDSYLADYAHIREIGRRNDAPFLRALREQAIARFSEIGFPGAKNEDWKYTSVAPILRVPFHPVPSQSVRCDRERVVAAMKEVPGIDDCPVLVFIDGHLLEECSRLDGVERCGGRIGSLRTALEVEPGFVEQHLGRYLGVGAHAFAALNTAFVEDGSVIHIPRGVALDTPVHVFFHAGCGSGPAVAHPRNLIVADAGSAVTVVEHYVGPASASYLTNQVTEISVGERASVDHCRIQEESSAAFHVGRLQVRQARDSTFRSHAIAFGGGLSRTEIHVELAGEGAECGLFGLYAVTGEQHVDHHTVIDHAVARTRSRELYKGILDGHSRGVFTGRVIVREDAQKISASQTNKNLLLHDGAVVETRPQLEIYADDVQCNHGAAIGRLDEDKLFYMRARGIDEAEARRLLTYGFATEVVESLPSAELKATVEKKIVGRLGGPLEVSPQVPPGGSPEGPPSGPATGSAKGPFEGGLAG